MQNKLYILIFSFLFVLPCVLKAQSKEKIYMHKGNKAYVQKDYATAETYYRKALEQNAQNSRARYNLGNTLLFQKKPKDAMVEYEKAAPLETNPTYKASMYHNMGVILQSQKQFAQAIECYKESLRNNSLDDESRYNLALCQYQMKNQQQNQDKNKDNGDGKDKDSQQKQQNKPNQEKDDKDNKNNSKSQKNEMSKDNADQLLQAAQMKEKDTQEKVKKAQMRANRKQMDNNW